MPNQITIAGLQIKSNTDIIDDFKTALQAIYGSDINVEPNSPDGQLLNIVGQAATDILELLVATYNSFSVQTANGIYLDQRVALNGLVRKSGTYTTTNVTVVTSGSVNLTGLDALTTNPNAEVFTVADGTGTQFYLVTSATLSTGSHSLGFRAKDIGRIETTINTITNQVTVVQGVTSVNNPSTATATGINEETDAQLKVRHAQSFFIAATGPADAVEGALLNLTNVTDAFVAENVTASPVNSVPAHSIWCIVEGGNDTDIAQAIYNKKAPGCGMKGSVTSVVTRPNGSSFTAQWDIPIVDALTIEFTVASKVPGVSFDTDFLADQLASALIYKLNDSPSIGDVIIAMNTIEPRAVLTALGVSKNGGSNYYDTVSPTTYQHKFSVDATDINITTP